MERRTFIATLFGLSISYANKQSKSNKQPSILLLPTKGENGIAKLTANTPENYIWMPVDYRPHALVELFNNRVLVLPKEPQSFATILSLKTLKPVGELKAKPGFLFMGHGSLSKDKKNLVIIEATLGSSNYTESAQVVILENGINVQRAAVKPLGHLTPHDVLWKNSDTLILNQRLDAYGGEKLNEGNAYTLNLSSGRLEKWIKSIKEMSIGHFYPYQEDLYVVLVSNKTQEPKSCFGKIKHDALNLYQLKSGEQENFKPGALHVAFNFNMNHAAVTFPWEGIVRLFDLKKEEQIALAKFQPDSAPLAIEYDMNQSAYFIFSTDGNVFKWLPLSGEPQKLFKIKNASAESHIYWWKEA